MVELSRLNLEVCGEVVTALTDGSVLPEPV